MELKNVTVAIDGPASSGKSTVAKQIAENFSFIYIDTGAMYRAITYVALINEVDIYDENELSKLLDQTSIHFERSDYGQVVFVNDSDVTSEIRENDVTNAVSVVSAHPLIREEMVARQHKLSKKRNVVMDGRDIGTVVLPNANVKIFLVASVEERAKRRFQENQAKGVACDFEQLKKEIQERDFKDSNRKVSPLKKAEDAIEIDTTHLSIQEVINKIEEIIENNLSTMN